MFESTTFSELQFSVDRFPLAVELSSSSDDFIELNRQISADRIRLDSNAYTEQPLSNGRLMEVGFLLFHWRGWSVEANNRAFDFSILFFFFSSFQRDDAFLRELILSS